MRALIFLGGALAVPIGGLIFVVVINATVALARSAAPWLDQVGIALLLVVGVAGFAAGMYGAGRDALRWYDRRATGLRR